MSTSYLPGVVAVVLLGAGCGGSSAASTPPPSTPATTSSQTTTGNVPAKTEKVYLATAIACSKLGGEGVSFTPMVVAGPEYTATIQPTNDCRELAMFNSYVYDVPIPKSGKVTITPGNQSPAKLDVKKLTASGDVTVYYARHGAGDFRVSVIAYKRTADVKGAG